MTFNPTNNLSNLESMDEEDAKAVIESLIMGKHPKTGEDIPENSILKDSDVVRALYTILKISGMIEESECDAEVNTTITAAGYQFHLSDAEMFRIISQYNVSITKFIQRIKQTTDCSDVEILTPSLFNKWLLTNEYIFEKTDTAGKRRKCPTNEGLRIGIIADTYDVLPGYQVPSISLSPEAQEFFLENLGEIISSLYCSADKKNTRKNKAPCKRDEQSLPFDISIDQIREVISEEEVGIAQFVRKINSVIQNDKMCIPSSNEMLLWMERVGILVFVDKDNGGRHREPTGLGKSYGIILKNQVKDNGEEYIQTLYTKKAQIFLLSSIPEILEMRE